MRSTCSVVAVAAVAVVVVVDCVNLTRPASDLEHDRSDPDLLEDPDGLAVTEAVEDGPVDSKDLVTYRIGKKKSKISEMNQDTSSCIIITAV